MIVLSRFPDFTRAQKGERRSDRKWVTEDNRRCGGNFVLLQLALASPRALNGFRCLRHTPFRRATRFSHTLLNTEHRKLKTENHKPSVEQLPSAVCDLFLGESD